MLRTCSLALTQVNTKERIVGWYSTGPKIKPSDLSIHELYRRCGADFLCMVGVVCWLQLAHVAFLASFSIQVLSRACASGHGCAAEGLGQLFKANGVKHCDAHQDLELPMEAYYSVQEQTSDEVPCANQTQL